MVIKMINTQRVLSATQIGLADYAINPYRGCEFGCLYCYSQENKNIRRDGFKDYLGIKTNAPLVLEEELKNKHPKRVLLGSTTECFQYQELKHGVTEKILEILNFHKIPYTILTKSDLIEDYLHLIERNKENKVYFTLNFHNDNLINIFETNSPGLKKRLRAISEILRKNIKLRIHIGPCIPFVSSFEEIFNLIPKKVKEVNIEIYHIKQGNYLKILKCIDDYFGRDVRAKVESIYNNRDNYYSFSERIKLEARELNKRYNFKIFLIVPDYDKFYNQNIDYEDALI